ncbi:hypothetical protein [Cyanobium gracile]|uniref:Translation initiation factor IF-2 n=1 Tax=Cyanobium gracile UHCC 0281 TaxID=3110309 RepID=A0ABU5SXN2_9CYAN|nr:hypothetical protein [Cyanobium gracile]MEA5443178.1 hypothetical protein [Cyanobium gracile UHCC 0281]
MAPPRPSLSLAGTLLTLPLLLSACGGTAFGDALSRSFSRAPAAPASPPATTPRTATSATPAPSPAAPARPAEPLARPAAPATPVTPVAPAVQPAPYRVTIRLPLADPSAPAEVVTKALRAAGVPFEVETIERMPAAGTPATETPATGSVAPATGSAAPASRPAPAPR